MKRLRGWRYEESGDISGDVIVEVGSFEYLGSFVKKDGGFVVDVKHRIKCSWMK